MDDPTEKKRLDTPLARRLHQALIADGEELFSIVRDPAPEVLRASLRNPRLAEDHLLVLLKRRDLPEDLLKTIHQRVKSGSKEAAPSHRLRLALARNPGTPGPLLQNLLPHLRLFELLGLCFLAGGTPDQRLAAERAIIQRLPTTELGNKITLARRATSTVVGELLKEGDVRLMDACLSNPRLKEISIAQFLQRSNAGAEAISAIARHPRWKNRPNLRLSMLKHRNTPAIWFTLFLPRLNTRDIRLLLASRRLNPRQKSAIAEELKKRGIPS